MSIVDQKDPSAPVSPGEELPEGAEAAPPGVRTMAVVRWALIALMAVAAVAAWVHFARTGHEVAERSEAKFVCPMHPSVLSERAGSCPICGMDLVSIASLGEAAKGGKGGGGEHAHGEAAPGKYWCPMHPEVASDDPNAICTKCGSMKLIPREQVPGLATVEVGQDRLQLIGMRTAPAVVEKLSPTLRTVGMVAPDEGAVALVTSRITGWVERLLVTQSGERVKKGQPLAKLYSQDIATAQLNYLNAIKWTRDWNQGQGQPGSQALEVDARQRLLLLGFGTEDIKELEDRKAPLEFLTVRSPIDGYVGRREAQVGAYIVPGQELYEIADIANVWVLADVYEADIGRVHAGQRATLALQALPGETFVGKVAYLYPAVNPASRTMQARIAVPNTKGRLRPGMYTDVTIDLGSTEGISIPADALVDTGEAQYVFVALPGGRFEPRPVTVGARTADKVQILRGVHPGENVVTTANFLIDSESRLRAAIQGFGGK
ncbi:MAG TPA: efflux RND transporter periplasmic adaptor subunit [Anaeromyxobacteraceae bacterium]|nr:efflux RND transporter periplasmic adaptor subunit [Anaeromyxobacteraceae bacterium]